MQSLAGAVCVGPVCDGDGAHSGVYGDHALAGGAWPGTSRTHGVLNGRTRQLCSECVCVQSILCLLLDFFSDEFVMRFYVCVIELFAGSCSLA